MGLNTQGRAPQRMKEAANPHCFLRTTGASGTEVMVQGERREKAPDAAPPGDSSRDPTSRTSRRLYLEYDDVGVAVDEGQPFRPLVCVPRKGRVVADDCAVACVDVVARNHDVALAMGLRE